MKNALRSCLAVLVATGGLVAASSALAQSSTSSRRLRRRAAGDEQAGLPVAKEAAAAQTSFPKVDDAMLR